LTWEIVVAADGGTEQQWEKLKNVRCIRIRTGSPQGTRDAGIREAAAATVLVVEDHVIISDVRAFYDLHKAVGGAMTFPARIGEGTSMFGVYGTTTNWDGNLWFKQTLYSYPLDRHTYRVPQFGHSCFMLDRNAYLAVGGYTDLLKGWGGEESHLCLKFWMMGYQLWQTALIWHAHFLADRTGGAMLSEDFQKNFKIVKFVISGDSAGLQVTPPMLVERQRIKDGPFKGDINLLREHFKREGIAE
jgi:glycosyl transferase family 7 (putative galactosyltransferase)